MHKSLNVLTLLFVATICSAAPTDKDVEECFLVRRLHAYNQSTRAYDPAFDEKATRELCEVQIEAGKQRIASARENWRACLAKEIVSLDDRVSPASDIATAVQYSCETEYEVIRNVANTSSGLPPDAGFNAPDRQATRAKATRDVALPLVLKLRAVKPAVKEQKKAKAPHLAV